MAERKAPRRAVVRGASGHAAVVLDAARAAASLEIVGLLDDLAPERRGDVYSGAPVLGGAEQLPRLRAEGVDCVLLGVGNCAARLRLAEESEALGFALPPVVHPSAVVAPDVELGPGTFVAAGAVINAGARLGRAVIVNSNAVVEHHCVLGDGVHVAPGALLAGAVTVGRLSWIGIGAVVIEKLAVGEGVTLGAGAVLVRDLADGVVAFAVPAVSKG